ncbi:hypothetical protein A5658_08245 [Mycobacterium sp. 1245111.1]|nr:hypothetical protein A5658_08245 [Mycobacterium sp. 1245111.1]
MHLALPVITVGLAHFVRPGIFEPITRLGFPERPRTFTYINGAVETLIGVLIALPQFRPVLIVVTLCYGFHFGGNVVRSRARH